MKDIKILSKEILEEKLKRLNTKINACKDVLLSNNSSGIKESAIITMNIAEDESKEIAYELYKRYIEKDYYNNNIKDRIDYLIRDNKRLNNEKYSIENLIEINNKELIKLKKLI